MKLTRSLIGACAVSLMVGAALLAVHFRARAVDAAAGIRIDSTPVNRSPQSGNSYSPVVKKVAPSVINIYSSRIVKERLYQNPLMADPYFRQFFGDQGSEVTSRDNWLGSGIIVSPNGYILTANHVVEGADEIRVSLQDDKTEYSARVIGMDPPTDVAILKIDARNLPAVTLGDSDQLEVGDVVLAIGNPFGIGQTVTRGIISALGRSLSGLSDSDAPGGRHYQSFIQTDAAINQGNSGGALVDAEGRLIGINDAIVSPSGTSAGIGFAVPINMARSVMDGFLNGGKVSRGYLGVDPQDITAALARMFDAPSADGALVTAVAPHSPAAAAGLLSGDVVVAINDKPVTSAESLRVTVSEIAPGTQVPVKIYRNGVAKTLTVTLGATGPDPAMAAAKTDDNSARQPVTADALDGVEVQDLDAGLRLQLRAPHGLSGALVIDVDRASNSFEAGLRRGDLITEINRQPVTSADDAVRQCKAARTDVIVVKVWRPLRGGVVRYLEVDNAKRAN
jgi:serine protease Do